MNKKILIIIAVIVLLGVGVYFYSKKVPVGTEQTGGLFPEEGLLRTITPGTGGGDGGGANMPFTLGPGATIPRLYELHKTPVAGVGFIESGTGANRTVITRYIERGLGHIYETPLSTFIESRISNETHLRLSEALWGNGGKSVIIRSFDKTEGAIKTSILNLSSSVTPLARDTSTAQIGDFIQTEEIFLPDYIPFLAIAEDGSDKIFYLQNGNTSSAGLVTNFRGIVTSIFSSTFTEWLPQFPNQNLVTLTTKPSARVPGHFFFLNTKTRATTKILSDINGLTTLTSRNGTAVLFSETKNGIPELYVYNFTKKEILPLFIQTLPEKCAWSVKESAVVYCAVPQTIPTAEYPDQWYQGLISFSDSIWKINTVTSVAQKIHTLPSLDVINPAISSDDTYFLFMNKITSTPWVYRITDGAPTITITTETTTKNIIPASTDVTDGMVKIR